MTHYGRSTYVAWGNAPLDVMEITSSLGATTETIEVTKYGSLEKHYVPSYTDYGSVSVTISSDRIEDINMLRQASAEHQIGKLTVVTPVGLQLTCDAFITNIEHVFEKRSVYAFKVTFKLTGKPTPIAYTLYSIIPPGGSVLYKGGSYAISLTAAAGTRAEIFPIDWTLTGMSTRLTRVVGNTLLIGTGETGELSLSARIAPDGKQITIGPVKYTVTAPAATDVTVTGQDTIQCPAEGGQAVTANYFASVIPPGAAQLVQWAVYNASTHVATVQDDGITIDNHGVVTVTEGFVPGQERRARGKKYEFYVAATVASTTGLRGIKYITVQT